MGWTDLAVAAKGSRRLSVQVGAAYCTLCTHLLGRKVANWKSGSSAVAHKLNVASSGSTIRLVCLPMSGHGRQGRGRSHFWRALLLPGDTIPNSLGEESLRAVALVVLPPPDCS